MRFLNSKHSRARIFIKGWGQEKKVKKKYRRPVYLFFIVLYIVKQTNKTTHIMKNFNHTLSTALVTIALFATANTAQAQLTRIIGRVAAAATISAIHSHVTTTPHTHVNMGTIAPIQPIIPVVNTLPTISPLHADSLHASSLRLAQLAASIPSVATPTTVQHPDAHSLIIMASDVQCTELDTLVVDTVPCQSAASK